MTSRTGGHFFRGADLNSEFRRNSDGSGRAENEGRGVRSRARSAAPRFHRARQRKQAPGVFSLGLFRPHGDREGGVNKKPTEAPKSGSPFFGAGADLNSEFQRNSDGSGRAENEGRGARSQGSLRRSPFSSGASVKTSPRRVFARLISPAPQKALKTLSFQGFLLFLICSQNSSYRFLML